MLFSLMFDCVGDDDLIVVDATTAALRCVHGSGEGGKAVNNLRYLLVKSNIIERKSSACRVYCIALEREHTK